MYSLTRYRFLAALLASLLVVPGAALAEAPPPLSAYGALPEVEDAAISATGRNIAVLTTVEGTRLLAFFGPDMQVFRTIEVGDIKVRYFDWIDDDRLLLVSSKTEKLWGFTTDKIEMRSAQIIPVTYAGKIEIVFDNNKNLVDAIFGDYGVRRVGDTFTGYFGAIKLRRDSIDGLVFEHGRPFLYEVDLALNTARQKDGSALEGVDREWVVGADGSVAAIFDLDMNDGTWRLTAGDGTKIASGEQPAGRASVVGLGYDGSTVIYAERDANGSSNWFEVPLTGGTPRPFLAGADVERLYWDPATGHLAGYLDGDEGPKFASAQHQSAVSRVRKAFSAFDMRIVDWTGDFGKMLVRTSGNGDSGSWYVVDLATMKATGFAWERLAIEPDRVGPISTFAYTASDGLEMDGILTLPPGREAKDLPVIVLPHGGPHSEDDAEFDWWAQALASRGYAVLQPNFRGSTNRSQAFKLAGYGEWGRKMQTDLSDGLAALAAEGIVDPSRACIMGASYGGYAALAGVTLQQGIYRCAVAVAPVSDLRDMYNEDYRASGDQFITKTALLEQLGPKDGWNAVSPRRSAASADAPILLIHGKDDTVVPYSHSARMADALKDAGKPYRLIALEGEDHWLSLSATRLQMLQAAVAFVEEHNPAD